ncbi:protein BIG GRAIN 1-like E [Mercurialis annua]|uniref:protein BIG GRAIN 1-like E n=1 Tax=Mercurialis annua TaxID=3986 RepID=UPI0024AE5162|nr:protein BIG GRAIN 1-like E [Mercurialis annua]
MNMELEESNPLYKASPHTNISFFSKLTNEAKTPHQHFIFLIIKPYLPTTLNHFKTTALFFFKNSLPLILSLPGIKQNHSEIIQDSEMSDTSKHYKKTFHRRNDSDEELDVFEAAMYFSGYNENSVAAAYNTQKILKDDHRQYPWKGGRKSLDLPMRPNQVLPQQAHHHTVEKQILKEKKYKQPSSPGGRLASFLNSLFNQTSSKKKKSKSAAQSMKDDDESPGGRRKRRSSISHFRSSSITTDTKSLYSSSSSGFRTPPPTKNYRSNSDHTQIISLPKQNGNAKSTGLLLSDIDKKNTDLLCDPKTKNLDNHRVSENDRIWNEKEFRKFDAVDDGAESDSSSDLFELQNYDLGIYSSGLPVYETTHMDNIKRVAPISNGILSKN